MSRQPVLRENKPGKYIAKDNGKNERASSGISLSRCVIKCIFLIFRYNSRIFHFLWFKFSVWISAFSSHVQAPCNKSKMCPLCSVKPSHIHIADNILEDRGRAIAQAVSRRLPTSAARVQTRVWSCGILWWTEVAVGQVFSENFGFPCQSTFHLLLHNHLHYHPRLAQ
jgi:hypothetical protein